MYPCVLKSHARDPDVSKRFKFVKCCGSARDPILLDVSITLPAAASFLDSIHSRKTHWNFIPWLFAHRMQSSMEESKAKELSYGWLKLRPRWLQFLNTPKWFLFFLCQYFFTQSIIVNGVYPGSISTIEKRFGFTRLVMAHSNSNNNNSGNRSRYRKNGMPKCKLIQTRASHTREECESCKF